VNTKSPSSARGAGAAARAEAALRGALAAHGSGRLDEAEALCREALATRPGHGTALHLLGVFLHEAGRVEEAAVRLAEAVAVDPKVAEAHLHLGNALADLGRLDEAVAAYGRAIALAPSNAGAHNDFGLALRDRGEIAEAVAAYRRAIDLKPDFAEALNNLGNALLDLDQPEEALEALARAVTLAPDFLHALNNLGGALQELGRTAEAVAALRRAHQLDPGSADILTNLGLALIALGRAGAAVKACERAVALNPGSAGAHNNLGSALMEARRLEDAAASLERAIALDPGLVAAHYNLGHALRELKRYDAAAGACLRATEIAPGDGGAHYVLGTVRQEQGRLEDAARAYGRAAALDPEDVRAQWAARLLLPVVYETEAEIAAWGERWARGIEELGTTIPLDTEPRRRRAADALTKLANFYLHYQGRDNGPLQKRYGALVSRIAQAAYPQYAGPPAPRPPLAGRRIRVGFWSSHIRRHTITKLFGAWMTDLDPARFEVFVFAGGVVHDEASAAIEAGVHAFRRCPRVDADALAAIAGAGLDALVFLDIGMDPMTQLVAALRLAPVQCMAWGHPVTSGLPTIDHMLSSALQEPADADAHYSERLVRLPNLSISVPMPPPSAEREGAPEPAGAGDEVVYFSAQSLYKSVPRYDDIYARIAAAVPNATFWFIADRLDYATERFRERLERAFADRGLDAARFCRIKERLDQDAFYDLNRQADVGLDTLYWTGCTSTFEALACGLPVVTWPGPMMRGRHSAAILAMAGLTDTIARDADHYVEIAVRLGRDHAWRARLRAAVHEHAHRVFDDTAAIRGLEAFFEATCRPAGVGPR
jgi:predicted O-linked N-acetylglucosamine transferase (SPINDLY family)